MFRMRVWTSPPRPPEEGVGKQVKTIEYRFHEAIPHKARSMASLVHRGEGRRLCDWGGPFKFLPSNQKIPIEWRFVTPTFGVFFIFLLFLAFLEIRKIVKTKRYHLPKTTDGGI